MRTIDADTLTSEIQKYANEPVKLRDRRWDTRCTAIIADMIGIVKTMPTIGGWINIKDRPPENGQLVVVRHEVKGRIYSEVAHYIMGLWWLDWDSNGLELNAISWTPLSEPEEANKDD